MPTDDSKLHWRAGAYSLEHEIVTVGAISPEALGDLNWEPRQSDIGVSLYFDDALRSLAARGVLVSIFGLTSCPRFGLRLRVKEALSWDGQWRHGVAVTMPVTTRQVAELRTFDAFAGTFVADALSRHTQRFETLSSSVSLHQQRDRWILQDPAGVEFVNLSQDRVTFEAAGRAVTSDFVEISTYTWPLENAQLSTQIQDTLSTIGGPFVRSKIEWFNNEGQS